MVLIGLTGGIASGKSIVSKRLAELGAVVVDADVLAREVVEPGTRGLAEIAAHFGKRVLRADGSLNRAALGAIVFADPAERLALNAITHPAVWARAHELFATAVEHDPNAIIVYDVPLLVEAAEDRDMSFDTVVVVNASSETRIQRLIEQRGMAREEAIHRLNSQATDAERLAIADVVIENDGPLEETLHRVDEFWDQVRGNRGSEHVSEAVPKLD